MSLIFLAGLPRSGSTLLLNILAQNPEFDINISSGLLELLMSTNHFFLHDDHEKAKIIKTDKKKILKSIVESYHNNIETKTVINKHRSWPSHVNFLNDIMNTQHKIICCVRNIWEIVDSFDRLICSNLYETHENLATTNNLLSTKADWLKFLVGISDNPYSILNMYQSMFELKEIYNYDNIHFIRYDDLCNDTETTLKSLYNFLEIKSFNHFVPIEQKIITNDSNQFHLGKNHHKIKSIIEPSRVVDKTWIKKLVSEDFFNDIDNMEFWNAYIR